MSKAVSGVSIVLVFLVIFVGCDQARSKFDQIELGMSRGEVIELLGEPQQSETKTLGSWSGEVLRWQFGGQTIVLQINNDQVQGRQLVSKQ